MINRTSITDTPLYLNKFFVCGCCCFLFYPVIPILIFISTLIPYFIFGLRELPYLPSLVLVTPPSFVSEKAKICFSNITDEWFDIDGHRSWIYTIDLIDGEIPEGERIKLKNDFRKNAHHAFIFKDKIILSINTEGFDEKRPPVQEYQFGYRLIEPFPWCNNIFRAKKILTGKEFYSNLK